MGRGGYRPGAGRKKGSKSSGAPKTAARAPKSSKVPDDIEQEAERENLDPLTYMLNVMNTPGEPKERRDRMAIAAAPFVHARKGEGKGKKDEKADRAKSAAAGKFAPAKPPLRMVK